MRGRERARRNIELEWPNGWERETTTFPDSLAFFGNPPMAHFCSHSLEQHVYIILFTIRGSKIHQRPGRLIAMGLIERGNGNEGYFMKGKEIWQELRDQNSWA